jgi:hypothetical protein
MHCITLQIVDTGNLASNVTYAPNNGAGVLYSLNTTVTGKKFRHVRSTPVGSENSIHLIRDRRRIRT